MSDKVWFYCWNSTTKNGQWHRAHLCRRDLVKENKETLYLSHLLCSRKIVLQDPCIRKQSYQTLFDRTSSVSQYETRTFDNRLKTTLTLDMSGSDVICTSDLRSITRQLWFFFNQTTFVTLTKFAAPQILSQYMTSDYLTSCERKTKNYRFTLVNKHEGTTWHFPVTFDLNGVEGIVYCEHRKVCCNYCHKAAVRPFLTSDHNFTPFIL